MGLDFKPHRGKTMQDVATAAAKCQHPVIEPKFDGWRFLASIGFDGEVTIYSRTGKNYAKQTPERILQELSKLPPGTMVDGEMVDLERQECTAVTNQFGKSKAVPSPEETERITYVLFDILYIGNTYAGDNPLSERREALAALLEAQQLDSDYVKLAPQYPAEQEVYDAAVDSGFEGVMVKDLNSKYGKDKQGHGWFKIKAETEIDVIVMGMALDGKGQHEGKVGKFQVGQHLDGELVQRANVNCYDDAMRTEMTGAQAAHEATDGAVPNPFVGRVCTIKHYGVLKDGLRHPTFVRWRDGDKPAEDVEFHNE